MEREGLEREGLERERLERGVWKDSFCITWETKHLEFTVPPAIALLSCKRCWNIFADFSPLPPKLGLFADFLQKREAAKLGWEEGAFWAWLIDRRS
jgi:hypothetical protein